MELTEEEKQAKWDVYSKKRTEFIETAKIFGFSQEQASFLFGQLHPINTLLGRDTGL